MATTSSSVRTTGIEIISSVSGGSYTGTGLGGGGTTPSKNAIDIVFIIDNTASMGNYISQVQANVANFINDLKSSSEAYRFGLVEYGDNNDSSIKTHDFTDDADAFLNNVNAISHTGGGSTSESGLEALESALSMVSDSANSKRFIVVTDAPYHNQGDTYDLEGDTTTYLDTATVVNHLKTAGVVVDVVGRTGNSCQTEWDEPVAQATGGKFYDISGDFPTLFTNIIDEITGTSTMHLSQWSYNFGVTTSTNSMITSSSSNSSTTSTTDLANSADLIDDNNFAYYYGLSGNKTINGTGSSDVIHLYDVTLEQITSTEISTGAVNINFNDGGSLTVLGSNDSNYLVNGSTWTANQETKTWQKIN